MIITFDHIDIEGQIETERWIRFLEDEKGITMMPDIKCGSTKLLATKRGTEIHFHRDGQALGHLIIISTRLEPCSHNMKVLVIHEKELPLFIYREGSLADRIIDKPTVTN